MSAAPVLLGSQGWSFPDLNGSYSQPNASAIDMLCAYGTEFSTVEVHDTFFGLPPVSVLQDWRESVPADFVFSLTMPQQITHERRLVGAERMLERFLERAAALGTNVGPILIRVPTGFRQTPDNADVLSSFVSTLPDGYRWAVEFRSAEWLSRGTLDLLGSQNVAVVLPDDRWLERTMMLDLASTPTADFGYVRWNGAAPDPRNWSAHTVSRNEVLSPWILALNELRSRTSAVFGYFGYQFHCNRPDIIHQFQRLVDPSGEAQSPARAPVAAT